MTAGIIGDNRSGFISNCYYNIDVASTGIMSGKSGSASPELYSTMKSVQFAKMLNTSEFTAWVYDKSKNSGYPMPLGLVSSVSKPIYFKVSKGVKQAKLTWKMVDEQFYIIY